MRTSAEICRKDSKEFIYSSGSFHFYPLEEILNLSHKTLEQDVCRNFNISMEEIFHFFFLTLFNLSSAQLSHFVKVVNNISPDM